MYFNQFSITVVSIWYTTINNVTSDQIVIFYERSGVFGSFVPIAHFIAHVRQVVYFFLNYY